MFKIRHLWKALLFVGLAAGVALQASAPARAQGKLVLYTSQPDHDATVTVEGFKAANPGIDVEIFRSGTTEIMTKLAAEFAGGAPKADVLLIADSVSMETLKRDNHLYAYTDVKLDGLRPDVYDKDKTYFGTKLITTGIAYNKAAKTVPTSWADLAKPDYKGLIVMPSPLYSGAAAIMMGALTERSELGWKYYDALKANGAMAVPGNGAVLTSVTSGEKPIGVIVDYLALNAKIKGAPVEFVIPKEGVIPVTEPVAIMKGTSNLAAAKKFVDFALSEKGQTLWSQQLGYIPARSGAPNPAWLTGDTKLNVMTLDNAAILKTADADKKHFSDLFGG